MIKSVRLVRFSKLGHILAGSTALLMLLAACSPATVTAPTAPATSFPTVALASPSAAVTESAATQSSTTAATEIATGAATSAATQAATGAATAAVTANATAAGTETVNAPLLIESDKLLGMTISDSSGQSLGTIQDVLVTTTGTVQAIVLNLSTSGATAGTPAATTSAVGTSGATSGTPAATTSAVGTTAAGTPAATSAAGSTSVATTAATAAATSAVASTSAATAAATSATQTVANGNMVAIPWTSIKADPTTAKLTYLGTASSLSSMATFDESMVSSGYVVRANGTSLPANYDGLIRLGGTLSDINLQTPTNDKLGAIQKVIIDMHSGMATYAVVDVGTFLGVSSQPVLVPFNKLQLDTTDATTTNPVLRLNVTKSSLSSAPKFDEGSLSFWPAPANNGWDSQIQLFWQTAAS